MLGANCALSEGKGMGIIMKIIALVGSSGTGKSHRALWVAHENNIDVLVDDGLLIKGHEIVAGTSAKKQKTAIGAIKTAIFTDENHAGQVMEEIKKLNPKSILVLGTSKEMVNRITDRLELPKPSIYLDIAQVSNEKEIEAALKTRQLLGQHVIPAPSVAVKPRLSGILIDPLHVGFSKNQHAGTRTKLWVNQTVVRPTFNFYGKFFITDQAMQAIVKKIVSEYNCIAKSQNITFSNSQYGTGVSLDLVLKYGTIIPILTATVQQQITETLEYMTALHIIRVDIYVRKLVVVD